MQNPGPGRGFHGFHETLEPPKIHGVKQLAAGLLSSLLFWLVLLAVAAGHIDRVMVVRCTHIHVNKKNISCLRSHPWAPKRGGYVADLYGLGAGV